MIFCVSEGWFGLVQRPGYHRRRGGGVSSDRLIHRKSRRKTLHGVACVGIKEDIRPKSATTIVESRKSDRSFRGQAQNKAARLRAAFGFAWRSIPLIGCASASKNTDRHSNSAESE